MVICGEVVSGARLPLIEREEELQTLSRWLQSGVSCITLTGPMGIGKSRLARELYRVLPAEGRCYVELFRLDVEDGEEEIARVVLRALGVPLSAQPLAQTIALLSIRPVVLFFDGVDTAREGMAAFLETLWHHKPEQSVVLTARKPLSLPEEHTVLLTHLSEGIPLTVELNRTRPAAIVPYQPAALDDAIHASYAMLDSATQRTLRSLIYFRGGVPLDAISAVSGVEPTTLRSQLATLTGVALVHRHLRELWSLPEPIRLWVSTQLSADERRSWKDDHTAYYERLAIQLVATMGSAAWREAQENLEDAYPNLRLALRARAATGDETPLALALTEFWLQSGRIQEGLDWFALHPGKSPKALLAAARLALASDENEVAQALFQTAQAGAPNLRPSVWCGLAEVELEAGNTDEAAVLLQHAWRMNSETGEGGLRARILTGLGQVAMQNGDTLGACRCFESSIGLYHLMGDLRAVGEVLIQLSALYESQSDFWLAIACRRKSLSAFLQSGSLRRGLEESLDLLVLLPPQQELALLGALSYYLAGSPRLAGIAGRVATCRARLTNIIASAAWHEGRCLSAKEALVHCIQLTSPTTVTAFAK